MNSDNAAQQDNAGKFRPFDATKCKPGDPVVRRDGTRGEFLAYEPRACRFHVASVLWQNGWIGLYSATGEHPDFPNPIIGLPPLDPLDEVDPSPGNVNKLTRRQVGEGYRIPAHDETAPGGEDIWLPDSRRWTDRSASGDPYCRGSTYRVPIAPAALPLEQSDIVLGKTVVRPKENPDRSFLVVSVNATGVFMVGFEFIRDWIRLRESWEISFDHGVTWQKAEKKGGTK